MILWPVVPICEAQKQDVNPKDLIGDFFRICDVCHARNGVDPLPRLIEERYGLAGYSKQFIVQLKGCPFRCPYCYVTPDGVNENPTLFSTEELVQHYRNSGCNVFHLMGGAPAKYIDNWHDIIDHIIDQTHSKDVFHSDMLLTECEYSGKVIEDLSSYNRVMYAISLKATSIAEWESNTGTQLNDYTLKLMVKNLFRIIDHADLSQFYFTFTNCDPCGIDFLIQLICNVRPDDHELHRILKERCYNFPVYHYKALDYKR